jgi:colanic acid/amylovoran biosynthesis glycosyltransferase
LKRNLIIYRDDLLAPSEAFIRTQGEALEGFQAFYVGLRRNRAVSLPDERVVMLTSDSSPANFERRWFTWMQPSRAAVRTIAALQPALIHAHFGPDATHILPIARNLQIPLLATFHGYDATTSDQALAEESLMLRLYVRRRVLLRQYGTAFLCVSDFIRSKLLSKGFPEERTHVHYLGVDTKFFSADESIARQKLVLFVGRLVENKGCKYLLRAMGAVRETQPDAALVIIGDGPLRPELEHMAKEMRIGKVLFLGAQPPEIIRFWLNRARVFCVPSIEIPTGASEGFGLVFAEAQSMGTPVASFATGGIPEAVADGRTGLLCNPGDWRGLACQIDFLLSSTELWKRLSAAGRERVTRYFDVTKQSAAIEQMYEQWIEPQQTRSAFAVERQ